MIEIKNISKTFSEGSSDKIKALDNVSISIPKGEFLIVIGANGSGKSTLLNIISGNILADSGSIVIEGIDVSLFKEYKRAKWIARIFQNSLNGVAAEMSILENFRIASLRTKSKKLNIGITEEFRRQVKEKISILNMGLEDKTDSSIGNLSGGQRQALTLVMAVMDESKIILLDEPTAALDPRSSILLMQNVNKIIKEYGLTSILITHHLKDAYQYGTRLIQLHEGRVIRDLDKEQKSKLSQAEIQSYFEKIFE